MLFTATSLGEAIYGDEYRDKREEVLKITLGHLKVWKSGEEGRRLRWSSNYVGKPGACSWSQVEVIQEDKNDLLEILIPYFSTNSGCWHSWLAMLSFVFLGNVAISRKHTMWSSRHCKTTSLTVLYKTIQSSSEAMFSLSYKMVSAHPKCSRRKWIERDDLWPNVCAFGTMAKVLDFIFSNLRYTRGF